MLLPTKLNLPMAHAAAAIPKTNARYSNGRSQQGQANGRQCVWLTQGAQAYGPSLRERRAKNHEQRQAQEDAQKDNGDSSQQPAHQWTLRRRVYCLVFEGDRISQCDCGRHNLNFAELRALNAIRSLRIPEAGIWSRRKVLPCPAFHSIPAEG